MQVTPETWEFVETVLLARSVPRTTEGNVRVGLAYLEHLLQSFEGDERLAIAAYHQGARAVRQRGLFAETEHFVDNVLALKQRM
jgi:soluble lytic murein transglycosylase-like protein